MPKLENSKNIQSNCHQMVVLSDKIIGNLEINCTLICTKFMCAGQELCKACTCSKGKSLLEKLLVCILRQVNAV